MASPKQIMSTPVVHEAVRQQLLQRRSKLSDAAARSPVNRFAGLLDEVDSALARVDHGAFGLCEVCQDTIEAERLIADPLTRFCLDHLTAAERGELQRDLELACQIQKGLLPPREFRSGGWHSAYHYEPAALVSGDYCDVIDGGEAGLFFLLGDVSGKGVAAAMLMAHLHAMFRTLVSLGMPLKEMVERASRVFCESTLPMHYATLICGRACADGALEICNAGHPCPLVMRGRTVNVMDGTGLPLGMFCEEEFVINQIRLEAGHGVVLYTDGFSEATGDGGKEYGWERMAEVISNNHHLAPADLIMACRRDLNTFCSGRTSDDLTMLALRRAEA